MSGEAPISVFIVADIRLYRDGLAQSLNHRSDIWVAGTAVAAEGLAARLLEFRPDIVLIDAVVPGSLGAIRAIRHALPGSRVVALAVPETDEDVIAYAEAGAAGFVPRAASLDELAACLRSVSRGEVLCSPKVAGILLRRVAALAGSARAEPPPVQLTSRQAEILTLIGQGLSNKEIAARLCIELSTVKNHVHQILDRLQVHRRSEAVALMRPLNGSNGVDLDHFGTKGPSEKAKDLAGSSPFG
jgi:two-component system, NarL family, nitrate/nitrite response regulator NarL